MARSRKRRLGHVTYMERMHVSEALTAGTMQCVNMKGQKRDGCLEVVRYIRGNLERRGFQPFS